MVHTSILCPSIHTVRYILSTDPTLRCNLLVLSKMDVKMSINHAGPSLTLNGWVDGWMFLLLAGDARTIRPVSANADWFVRVPASCMIDRLPR